MTAPIQAGHISDRFDQLEAAMATLQQTANNIAAMQAAILAQIAAQTATQPTSRFHRSK